MNKPIKHWADDEKPREKLVLKGKSSLSNAELIGILLSTGTKTKSAVDLGRELLELAQNDLNLLARFNVNEIKKIKGIGVAKAITVIAAIELASRRKLEEAIKQKVNSSKQAFEILEPLISDNQYEEFWILLLNRANKLISCRQISEGGISGTVVDTRKIFKIALEENACSIIIAHNHPSGNLQPSESDKSITKKIKESGVIIDIKLIDHLIIANNKYFSFADEGLV
ncbi:MAG: DNA repair protein RadC [Bacteroidetes bacterium]|nr:DNA repair protein RadC [Bacteroidota bacterium]